MQSATFTLSRLSLPLHNHKSRTPFKHSLHFDPIHFSTSSSKTQRNRHFQWRFLILHSPVLVPPFFLLIQIQAPSFAPSDSVGDSTATPSGTLFKTLELGALFGLWYLFNIYFNIYNKQIEPILSGNLPPGFDSSICRNEPLKDASSLGKRSFGQPIKVNWAYASSQREDTSGHFNIFVGDLSPEVTDSTLFACFSVYPSCSRWS